MHHIKRAPVRKSSRHRTADGTTLNRRSDAHDATQQRILNPAMQLSNVNLLTVEPYTVEDFNW